MDENGKPIFGKWYKEIAWKRKEKLEKLNKILKKINRNE
jgi:hypothetical protein